MKLKTLIVALILLANCCWFVGCNGVILNPTYSQLLDQTATLAATTDARWDTLTPAQQKQAFHGDANLWAKFKAAKDGVATVPATQP